MNNLSRGIRWFIFPLSRYLRFKSDGEMFVPFEEDEDSDISHYIHDDYGSLVPVFYTK